MLPDFETLVEEIKIKRRMLDWSQKELAKRSGVSQSLVAKLEQKMNVPNYESIKRIHSTIQKNMSSPEETAGELANPGIVSVKPEDTRGEVAEVMRENDFSQIPVRKDDDYIGILLSKDIGLTDDETPVKDLMWKTIPKIPENTGREAIKKLLETNSAALVKGKDGKTKGIITPADLL